MNESDNEHMRRSGGAFADGLTLIRILLTPVVMFLIIAKGWPEINTALLVAILFAVAALTDLFDDMTGGTETSVYRKLGWVDDIADTILVVGTLAAMAFVIHRTQDPAAASQGKLTLMFMIPVGIIIARELIVALVKGMEFTRTRMFETGLGNFKTAMIMLGTCILLAAPWLTPLLTSVFAKGGAVPKGPVDLSSTDTSAFDAFVNTSGLVWTAGLIILWIGAILSVITGIALLRGKYSGAANDG